jgi:hypothetical protein
LLNWTVTSEAVPPFGSLIGTLTLELPFGSLIGTLTLELSLPGSLMGIVILLPPLSAQTSVGDMAKRLIPIEKRKSNGTSLQAMVFSF